MDFESPAELLLEHGALLTFLGGAAERGRFPPFPADLLRENGQIFIFSSAALTILLPPPPFFSRLFSFVKTLAFLPH